MRTFAKRSDPATRPAGKSTLQSHPPSLEQRPILQLQYAIGNQAVHRMLHVESTGLSPAEVPAVVRDVLAAPGQPLDAGVRGVMESRLGHDFTDVRVHVDAQAAAAAQTINARAYASGSDVVFDAGQYSPGTSSGRHLLAHELTHVVQQRAATSPPIIQRQLNTEGDKPAPTAHDADVAHHSEVRGREIISTELLTREGLQSKLVTTFDCVTMTRTQRLFRRSAQSPAWTDVTTEALRDAYLNPPGVAAGTLSVEWNMPGAKPATSSGGAGQMLSETIVSEIPPSLVIPYVKDSILTDHLEFTPQGENPYQHWSDTIGRRWSATGARKTSFWLNKVVTVAGAGVAAGGTVTSAGKGASALKAAADAEARSFKAGVRALQRFDLAKPIASKAEMAQGVRELEAGLKPSLPGQALDETVHQLTDLQRRALEENVRRVITKTIPAVREGGAGIASVVQQMANPRFRFLAQVPAARAALVDALKSIGMSLPAGW